MQLSTALQNLLKTKTDYSQNYIQTGYNPQNYSQESDIVDRFKDHPKMQELLKAKNSLNKIRKTPPMQMKADIKELNFCNFPKFDIIVIDPPWEEYKKRILDIKFNQSNEKLDVWSLEEIRNIRIEQIASNPSFIFLWVGSEHLDHGRILFKYWGLKRCEDIVWIKTNDTVSKCIPSHSDDYSYLKRTKEHCLVGIRGDNKKISESNFIHANIDTDVIISEMKEINNFNKPDEFYDIIERFCLGRKRLELFGNNQSVRPGWFTIGKDISESNFDFNKYQSWFEGEIQTDSYIGGKMTGTTSEIELLRPKSPPKQN